MVADKRDGTEPARLMAQDFNLTGLLGMAQRELAHWDRHGWKCFRIEALTADGWRETHHVARCGWFRAFIEEFRAKS